jgi:hypothetical protein
MRSEFPAYRKGILGRQVSGMKIRMFAAESGHSHDFSGVRNSYATPCVLPSFLSNVAQGDRFGEREVPRVIAGPVVAQLPDTLRKMLERKQLEVQLQQIFVSRIRFGARDLLGALEPTQDVGRLKMTSSGAYRGTSAATSSAQAPRHRSRPAPPPAPMHRRPHSTPISLATTQYLLRQHLRPRRTLALTRLLKPGTH